MDRSKLPLSLLVALGLAPEACTTKDGKAHPCLSAPIDDGKQPDTKDDPPVGPCLKVAPTQPDKPDQPIGPCLEIAPGPCLSPPVEDQPPDPPVGPCLKVMAPNPEPPASPCLSMPAPKSKPKPKPTAKDSGGMATRSRSEVIERVRAALPPDVAARLTDDSDDA